MLYYIQNKTAGFLGNALVFWAKNRMGYTPKLENAHKFTYEEAKAICEGNPEKNKAWAVDYIDNNEGTARVTDMQFLDGDSIINFDTPEDLPTIEKDELFEPSARLVVQKQMASASLLQRTFGLGYSRASKIIDQLEKHNIIGEFKGALPRHILIYTTEELDEFLKTI